MKLALHRSVIFWSGILVMAFICWAWWDSTRVISSLDYGAVTIRHGGYGVTVAQCPFRCRFPKLNVPVYDRRPLPKPEEWWKMDLALPKHYVNDVGGGDVQVLFDERYYVRVVSKWVPKNIAALHFGDLERTFTMSSAYSAVFVPYWLLLLAVALPWTGLLIWRARRRSRTPLPQ